MELYSLGDHELLLWIDFIQLSCRCDITEAEKSLRGREIAAGSVKDKQMKKMQMQKTYLDFFFLNV